MDFKVQSGTVQSGTSVWHPVDEHKPAVSESEPSEEPGHAESGHTDKFESTPGAPRQEKNSFNF